MKGTYEIRSKNHNLLFIGSSDDLDKSVMYHKFHLIKRIHPNPQLTNHVLKFGIDDLEFIINPEIVETASVKPLQEKRKRIEKTI